MIDLLPTYNSEKIITISELRKNAKTLLSEGVELIDGGEHFFHLESRGVVVIGYYSKEDEEVSLFVEERTMVGLILSVLCQIFNVEFDI